MSSSRYIEFDSTYRNRLLYPNPSQFTVQLASTTTVNNGIQAVDPISNSYPYYPNPPSAVTFAGGTALKPQLDVQASSVTNAYINSYLYDITLNESRLIIYYDGSTRTATLDVPFSGGWAAGDNYNIRLAPPMETSTIAAVTSSSSITLSPTSSSTNDFYKGFFLYILNGPAIYDVKMITSYNGLTKVATTIPFSISPVVGNAYQILPFTRDNYSNLNYSGSTVSQNELVCYEVRLLRLTLPNVNLWTGYGNRACFYPYFYVELSTTSSPPSNIIYSNNPNSQRALFTVSLTDDKTPDRTSFLHYEAEKMIQTVKFKPNDNFNFSVYLPNKQLFKTEPDNMSPLPPNPNLQINALFQITKI